jgi:hypothetical protein
MNKLDLAKQADDLLKRARCDAVTGEKKDRQYRRNKLAKNRKCAGHWRAKRKQLGKLGPASPGRHIAPSTEGEI